VVANANGTVWVSEYYANALALLTPAAAPHSDAVVVPNTHKASSQVAPVARTMAGPTPSTNTPVPPAVHTVQPSVTQGWIAYPIPTANADAEDMRVDRQGRVWFEEDAGLLGRLDPLEVRFTEYTIPSPNSGYYNIALDKRTDLLWFTEAGVFAPVVTKIGYLNTQY
jgi:virginiamycin B lyase